MKLKALDSFYSDETKMVSAKSVFEVDSDALGQDFVKRGLATEVGNLDSKDNKAAPGNKDAGAAPSNKAAK